jgi:hypothetical protein
MLSRKHYTLIASAISQQYLTPSQHDQLVRDLSTIFELDNPAFDARRFRLASEAKVPVAKRVE